MGAHRKMTRLAAAALACGMLLAAPAAAQEEAQPGWTLNPYGPMAEGTSESGDGFMTISCGDRGPEVMFGLGSAAYPAPKDDAMRAIRFGWAAPDGSPAEATSDETFLMGRHVFSVPAAEAARMTAALADKGGLDLHLDRGAKRQRFRAKGLKGALAELPCVAAR